ncbi:MAG TPA: XRE family transcriptional regulator [Spirochaetes bacterium]|nr:XRE family transcriptional regulator [Spirochaetota bacterium]
MDKGMSVKYLTRKTNLSASLISQVERGLITPSIPTLVKIFNAVGVPLVSYTGEKCGYVIKGKKEIILGDYTPSHSRRRWIYSFGDSLVAAARISWTCLFVYI